MESENFKCNSERETNGSILENIIRNVEKKKGGILGNPETLTKMRVSL